MPFPNPLKPGETNNLNGAPDGGHTWSGVYNRILVAKPDDEFQPLNKKELIASNDVVKAIDGKDAAINRIQDRTEGKPVQQTDITTGGDKLPGVNIDEWLAKSYGDNQNKK